MKRRTSISVCALLGVMVVTLAQGANLRYQGSGDYTNILALTGTIGWYDPLVPGSPTTLPGSLDEIRFNYGGAIVTLTTVAPDVLRLRTAVDEPGELVVESGGSIASTSTLVVGYNGGKIGRLTVLTNGVVNANAVMEVGRQGIGFLTIDGGTVNCNSHLWVGDSAAPSSGTIILTNGGTLNLLAPSGNGMIGLGTINAVSASGGIGTVKVNGGGVLNLYNIEPNGSSITNGSVLDISGSGVVTIPTDRTTIMSNYVAWGKITAYGGTGTVAIDYNTSTPGKTTLKAVGGYVPPAETFWIATSGAGLWSDNANWFGGFRPAGVTVVEFETVGAIPCVVKDSAAASCIIMGTNGPGGTLIVTNGGTLACGADNPSYIGYNSNALMVVENGGTVSCGNQLRLGFDSGSDGTLLMNGGTVSVSGMFDLGYQGGKGTAQIKGGTLNLGQFDDYASMGGPSMAGTALLDITGTGKVVLNGDHSYAMNAYISTGQITNSSGAGLLVDFNIINVGKTTVYPSSLVLSPAEAVWNPGLNPSSTGLWSETGNWFTLAGAPINMIPGDTTHVLLNIADAMPCLVSNAVVARYVEMGNSSGPGGTLIVTNGGSLTTGADNWTAVGYASNALMIVENGASVAFGYHLWVGFNPEADGTFILNGGTASVGGMFGLGWNGGKGTAQINGGTLNLAQLHPTDSINSNSVLNLTGTGTVVITGNQVTSVSNYVRLGRITANGGAGTVAYSYESNPVNKTTLQVAPPRQSITSVAVSGGNTTLTYETTAGHIYHIESTASLSPAAWTRVAGSTTTATGAPVTFSFPASGNPAFYRVVSP